MVFSKVSQAEEGYEGEGGEDGEDYDYLLLRLVSCRVCLTGSSWNAPYYDAGCCAG